MSRQMQKIVVLLFALALVIPMGAVGLANVFGQGEEPDAPPVTQEEDPRPEVDPEDQPTPTATEVPERPGAMDEQSAAGAEATLEHVLASYPYMMATGDVEPWTASMAEDCEVCVQFVANAQLLHEQGGYLVGGEFDVRETTFEGEGDPPTSGAVTADFLEAEAQLVDDPTREAHQLDAVEGVLEAQMVWDTDRERWVIQDMQMQLPEQPDGDG
ncbi:MAG: DUF6318 family protein [Brachybacterium sp.]|nr:DUF6318 family protein [Brachybacterium sp.]